MNFNVQVDPEGEVKFLYQDRHPLMGLGFLRMERASSVLWGEDLQRWFIHLPSGEIIGDFFGYESREEAIQAEVEILDRMLAN